MHDCHNHLFDYKNFEKVYTETLQTSSPLHIMTVTPNQYQNIIDTHQRILPDYFHLHLGLFPLEITKRHEHLEHFLELSGKTRYIGEIGLDGCVDSDKFTYQIDVFKTIVEKTNTEGSILSIHSRRAGKDTLNILSSINKSKSILHWYSDDLNYLKDIHPNIFFSINPQMIRSKQGKCIVQNLPNDRILLETDGPYTTTEGHQTQPFETLKVIQYLSGIWEQSLLKTEKQLKLNYKSLID